ncbi:hypothetical protein DFH06DRAFT_1131608 [Mycena polygramma]|nr:hypothetical protein DFH06DRAFT_1131608 [Mycena polygramma]
MATRPPLASLPAVSFNHLSDYLIVLTGSSKDILIRLPCFQQNPEDETSPKGIVAYIVFDACGVLTNNCTPEGGSMLEYHGARMPVVRTTRPPTKGKAKARAKGKAKTTKAKPKEDEGSDGEGGDPKRWRTTERADMVSLIRPGVYRFFLDADDKSAEVSVSSIFGEWELPSVIPLHWRRDNKLLVEPAAGMSQISKRVKDVDEICPFTRQTSGRESCHLIPKAEQFWFEENILAARTGDPQSHVNSMNNIMSLRGDLNKQGLDSAHFVFVPALSRLDMNPYMYDLPEFDEDAPSEDTLEDALNPPFMVFFLDVYSLDLTHSHHMRELAVPERIPGEYLYARFAYNVFLAARRRHRAGLVGDNDDFLPPFDRFERRDQGDDHPFRDAPPDTDDPDREGRRSPPRRDGLRSAGKATDQTQPVAGTSKAATKQRTSSDAPPPSKKAKYMHSQESEDLDLNPAWRNEFRLLKLEQYDRTLMDPKVPRPILQNAQFNGIEPGFSRAFRAAYEWTQAHPVDLSNGTVGRVGEEDHINEGLEYQ